MESASTELSNILEELFDLSGEELADLTVLVEQLGTLGLQSVADEISALRESLHLRASFVIPYAGGLYDPLITAPINADGLVIYNGSRDRFVATSIGNAAMPACSALGE